MAIATTSHSLLPLISFLFSLSLFILFLLSLFLKIHKTRRAPHLEKPPSCQTEPLLTFSTEEEEPPKEEDRKKKRRAKKKRQEPTLSESGIGDGEVGRVVGTGSRKGSAGTSYPLFPFTSLTSSLQRRIKLKYDDIVRSANQSSSLTVFQVTEFIDCLVEARDELQHRLGVIQRSFKIKKALLATANKSSYDRLWNEVDKLEKEHKRLESDAAIYNLLQEHLTLSPAYKTLLELSTKMEKEADNEQIEDYPDISFEELLAQEKKDSFWQRNGKMRSFQNNTGK
ncbi:CA-responsive protein [Carex rostrata]